MSTEEDITELIEEIAQAETDGRHQEIQRKLECRGRSCISKGMIKKAKDAAKGEKKEKEIIRKLQQTIKLIKVEDNNVYLVYPKCYCHKIEDFKGNIPETYCCCSIGWAKALFETALGREVEVELKTSVLHGNKECRIQILL